MDWLLAASHCASMQDYFGQKFAIVCLFNKAAVFFSVETHLSFLQNSPIFTLSRIADDSARFVRIVFVKLFLLKRVKKADSLRLKRIRYVDDRNEIL
jgi:hypothetical protein